MTMYFRTRRSFLEKNNTTALLLLLFLTGILLGTLLVRYFAISAVVFSGIRNQEELKAVLNRDFVQILLSCGKFLLLLYLLSFQRWGAMLVPPVFGLEGIYFGGTVGSLISFMGSGGVLMGILLQLFRFLLVLPYGFILGNWAIAQSLNFSQRSGNWIGVLAVTLSVMVFASFLECSLGRWLGGMYYLRFGV